MTFLEFAIPIAVMVVLGRAVSRITRRFIGPEPADPGQLIEAAWRYFKQGNLEEAESRLK